MKFLFTFLTLIIGYNCFAQCSFQVTLKNKGTNCLGSDTLVATSNSAITKIEWYNYADIDTTVQATFNNNPVADAITIAGGNGPGANGNQLKFPTSVYLDKNGNIFIADQQNNRIQKFPPGSTKATLGVTVAGGNGFGIDSNQFSYPSAAFVDRYNNIYVADQDAGRVQKFANGSTKATKGSTVAGGNLPGTAPNQLFQPTSVFVDDKGNIYVADPGTSRINLFPPGSDRSTNGVIIAGGNGIGLNVNQFNQPTTIFVDKTGYIYVADRINNRIQKFPPSSTSATNGETVAGGNGFGSAPNQFAIAQSVFLDASGNIYVADLANNRIQKFPSNSTSATIGVTIAGGNGRGSAANQLNDPLSIYVDAGGYIYVTDCNNHRIQKFSQGTSIIDSIFVPHVAGIYKAVITDNYGCTDTSNSIVIDTQVIPSIKITGSSGTLPKCTSQILDSIQFKAQITNGGTNPVYQWQLNGSNAGINNAYFSGVFRNNDIIVCKLTSSAFCAVTSTAVSDSFIVNFTAKPIVTISKRNNICSGFDTLLINSTNHLSKITWYKENLIDTIMTATLGENINPIYIPNKVGTYKAIVTDSSGCSDTSNLIMISKIEKPTINITTQQTRICEGDTVSFTAMVSNAGLTPIYQWRVNGFPTGDNSISYTNFSISKGDTILCIVSDSTGCFRTGASNSFVPDVKATPVFSSVNNISLALGQSVTLNIPVTGQIASYLWNPSQSLSNNQIPSPVATPSNTTIYSLKVTSTDGCDASDTIKVIVSSHITIPSAFTPNGDGLNDVFYVLGGQVGDKIKRFSIYNRWGKRLFEVHGVTPNTSAFGWNGNFNNIQQPQGTYIYSITIISSDGKEQIFKGPVTLIR